MRKILLCLTTLYLILSVSITQILFVHNTSYANNKQMNSKNSLTSDQLPPDLNPGSYPNPNPTNKSQLAPPTSIKSTSTDNSVLLSWVNVPFAVRYEINADGTFFTVNSLKFSMYSKFEHSGLLSGIPHTYYVRSIDIAGNPGEWSNQIVVVTKCTVPKNFIATPYLKEIKLSWDASDGATSYEVDVDGVPYMVSSGLTFSHQSLSPCTTHNYKIRACSSHGQYSEWSNTISSTTLLMSMKDIQTAVEPRKIVLHWKSIPSTYLYKILNGNDNTLIGTTDCAWFEITGLSPNSTYCYRIGTSNNNNVSESIIVATPKEVISSEFATPSLSCFLNNISEIELTWESEGSVTKYDIERNGIVISQVCAPYIDATLNYVDNTFSPTITNTYRVRANQCNVVGPWSDSSVILGIPNLKINTVTDTCAKLTWDPITEATQYDISIDGNIISIANEFITDSGFYPNHVRTYKIRAKNEEVIGSWSKEMKIIPVPSGFVVYRNWLLQDVLKWVPVIGASEYEIYCDGILLDTTYSTSYVTNPALPFSTHLYKVRAISSIYKGQWNK